MRRQAFSNSGDGMPIYSLMACNPDVQEPVATRLPNYGAIGESLLNSKVAKLSQYLP